MNKHTFFLASIALAFIALVLHSVAREKFNDGSKLKARQISLAVSQRTPYMANPTADRLLRSGHSLNQIGTVFTASAAAFVFVAMVRRESGWYSAPLLLLVFDLVVYMLL